ncbi:MAG: hypothetical protein HXX17_08200 [Geobacteraceae bacterium]|nr:hypothetical protein [Geobacteraceae bacterium]
MATRKFANVPPFTGQNDKNVIAALAGVVGFITAQQQPAISALDTTATTAQIIAKVNEIIARLQGTQ